MPLWRLTVFGRGYVDVELCFALFVAAAAAAIWVDRPERERRSVAALLALSGALVAAAAVLVLPGAVGHAGQTSPRGVAVPLDWLDLVSGSVWVGGLIGLLVLWRSLAATQRVAGSPSACRASRTSPSFRCSSCSARASVRPSSTCRARCAVADLVRQGDPDQGRNPPCRDAARFREPAANEARLCWTRGRLRSSARLLRRLVSAEVVFVAAAILVAAIFQPRLRRRPRSRRRAGARASRPRQGRVDGRARRRRAAGSGRSARLL